MCARSVKRLSRSPHQIRLPISCTSHSGPFDIGMAVVARSSVEASRWKRSTCWKLAVQRTHTLIATSRCSRVSRSLVELRPFRPRVFDRDLVRAARHAIVCFACSAGSRPAFLLSTVGHRPAEAPAADAADTWFGGVVFTSELLFMDSPTHGLNKSTRRQFPGVETVLAIPLATVRRYFVGASVHLGA